MITKDATKKIPFYKRKEFWGSIITAVSFAPEVLKVFPENTLAFKLALPVGLLLTVIGLRKGYKDENLIFQPNNDLPEGLRKNPFKKEDIYIGK